MKAIIRARVSTKEQEEGHSIAAQRQRLVDYCAASGYSAAPFCWAKIRPEELRQALIAEVALTGALGEDRRRLGAPGLAQAKFCNV